MNVLNILNTIRANASQFYRERVDEVTQNNLTDIGEQILTYEETQNEFVNALVNKIAFTEVSNRRFKNPLAVLKSGHVPFGNTIEEAQVNPAKDKGQPTKQNEVSELLSEEESDVATIYHSSNRYGLYKVSVSYEKLQTAFKGMNEMAELIQAIIDSMYSGDEIDEFELMKRVVSDGVENEYVVTMPLTYDGGSEGAKDLVVLLKTLSHNFTEASKNYNGYNIKLKDKIANGEITGRITWTPKQNQVLLIRSDVDAVTDVEVLAKAFNMEKVDFIKRKFVVSSFGDTKTLAVICDERFFKFKDNIYTVRSQQNGYSLVENYFLHHKQTISTSLFANCVAIVEAEAEAVATEEEPAEE